MWLEKLLHVCSCYIGVCFSVHTMSCFLSGSLFVLHRSFAAAKMCWTQDKVDEMLLPVLKRINAKEVANTSSSFQLGVMRAERQNALL